MRESDEVRKKSNVAVRTGVFGMLMIFNILGALAITQADISVTSVPFELLLILSGLTGLVWLGKINRS